MKYFRLSSLFLLLFITLLYIFFPDFIHAKPADIVPAADFPKAFTCAQPNVRPSRSLNYLSPGGHFIIHYDTSGYHSVAADYNYHPTIPDYIFLAAEYLEDSYDMLHDSLGFSLPPQDHSESPEIDVYFSKYSNLYGETYPEQEIETNVWTSYLTLCSDLEDSNRFYTTGIEGLKVTCAHELFHIFQLGYKYRSSDYFYFEMSSVWFEEFMYPEVNDYHSYFGEYTNNWNYALDHPNLYYNNAGFNLCLDSRYSRSGDNVIRAVWDEILNKSALDAISTVLLARGSNMKNALNDWGVAQVLCSPYAAANFLYPFHDASELPSISFSRYPDNIISGNTALINIPDAPMTSYYKFSGQPGGNLLLDFNFPDNMQVSLIALNGTQSRVYSMKHSPLIIDAEEYPEWILTVAATDNSDSGTVHITTLERDIITAISPNPLSPGSDAKLHYVLSDSRQNGSFALFDIRGRLLFRSELPAEFLTHGPHSYAFGKTCTPRMASGIYITVLELDGRILTHKMTILK